jgi:hypothetical protein
MTKKEFDKSKEPLVLIVSYHPETNECLHDYYEWDGTDYWLNKLRNDFPEYHTFMIRNQSATNALKKSYGL